MTELIRRFRGLGIAVVVLALSAGVVFAGAPRVALVSHETPPTVQPPTPGTETDDTDTDEPDSDADTGTDATDGPDAEAPETDEPAEGGEAPDADSKADDTHGALVSEAAHTDTPDGFRNHGAFVSCVAKLRHEGAVASFDWTTVTAETCAAVGEADTDADDGAEPSPTESADAGSRQKPDAGKANGRSEPKGQAGRSHGKGKAKAGR